MKTKPTRCWLIMDAAAPETDRLHGRWHNGWQIPGCPTIAFYALGQWWASKELHDPALGPFPNKTAALNA